MHELFLHSLAAGLGIAVAAAPVGSLLLWQRMAFFGDTIAHSAILGVALSLLFSLPVELGSILVALALACSLGLFKKTLSNDASLAIIAYGSLASAMVIISSLKSVRIDLSSYLFGDILAITSYDILFISLLALITLAWLIVRWNKILIITISEDLAYVEKINVGQIKLEFRLIIALLIVLAMKVIGIFLITAILIIPPATSRLFSHTPERMVVVAFIISAISVVTGLAMSFSIDSPAGASIILSSLIIFIISNCYKFFTR